jgi:hypothetical protein
MQDLSRPAEVFHKIRLTGRASRYSAWFDGSGFLVDCERIDARNRSFPCTQGERDALQRGGWIAGQHKTFATA